MCVLSEMVIGNLEYMQREKVRREQESAGSND